MASLLVTLQLLLLLGSAPDSTPPSVAINQSAADELQGTFEALMVRMPLAGSSLVEPSGGWKASGPFFLATSGGPARQLRAYGGTVALPPITAEAGLYQFQRSVPPIASLAECRRPDTICVRDLKRVDHAAGLPLDIEKALQEVLAEYGKGTPTRAALERRAEQLQSADLRANPGADARKVFWFWPSWNAQERRLDVTLIAHDERRRTTERTNPDPLAGRVGCSAPPGADCAPKCVAPKLQTVTEFAVEAAVRFSFDAQGARRGPFEAGSGALPARPVATDSPVGVCPFNAACPPAFAQEFPSYPGPIPEGGLPPRPSDDGFCACRAAGRTCAHWRTEMNNHYCGAMISGPRTCICDECRNDSDCSAGAGGKCLLFHSGGPCGDPLIPKVCVYAGDPCHPPQSCPSGKECQAGKAGKPVCGERFRGPPPP